MLTHLLICIKLMEVLITVITYTLSHKTSPVAVGTQLKKQFSTLLLFLITRLSNVQNLHVSKRDAHISPTHFNACILKIFKFERSKTFKNILRWSYALHVFRIHSRTPTNWRIFAMQSVLQMPNGQIAFDRVKGLYE